MLTDDLGRMANPAAGPSRGHDLNQSRSSRTSRANPASHPEAVRVARAARVGTEESSR